mgnify:FL=1
MKKMKMQHEKEKLKLKMENIKLLKENQQLKTRIAEFEKNHKSY